MVIIGKYITRIRVKKKPPQSVNNTRQTQHPARSWYLGMFLISIKIDNKQFLVPPHLLSKLHRV